ncbi:class I SAM-dependent methyltransferase [Curtobacterium sp. PhB115]|uniref:class I SAM-dependent methyltransferase n=1 Tax=Curtobacterium sp. PhB115 TaxID=2485173 RepID=UPI000F4BAD7D|nr:class I SAM-dependent methyltransferase [Curtobacterium sp. PhB115]ROP74059.1 methyltransferase family protein [Curtobacterium sp. PhB115]
MASEVSSSYSRRAAEYAERLGSMTAVHPSDVHLVSTWAAGVEGPLLDAGCGPGHWTAYLRELGHDARGVDQVAGFIEHARASHPSAPFAIGNVDALDDPADSYGGVLAWYSLIHHEPETIRRPLEEFARVLRPGGRLLVGFFVADNVKPLDHAVVAAYQWSSAVLGKELIAAGFDVEETHTRTASAPNPRPHGAILARLRPAG